MDQLSLFQRVLGKYGFVESLPERARNHIRLNKNRQFKRVLKKTGGYSIITGAVASLFFTLRKYGFTVSFYGSAVVTALAVTMVGGALLVSIYFTVQNVLTHDRVLNNREDVPAVSDSAGVMVLPPSNVPLDGIYGIQPFIAENVSSVLALSISDELSLELAKLLGDRRAINLRRGRKGKKIGLMVMGSVEKFEGDYVVNVRVSSVMNSRILFYTSASFKRRKDFPAACRRIAGEIKRSLK